jgi:hypothetical protein
MAERQAFLEKKFNGNLRLAEEFAYIQDPSVTKLEKWQKWKREAEADDRWTSWQTERSDAEIVRREKYKDPLVHRRVKRHRRRRRIPVRVESWTNFAMIPFPAYVSSLFIFLFDPPSCLFCRRSTTLFRR